MDSLASNCDALASHLIVILTKNRIDESDSKLKKLKKSFKASADSRKIEKLRDQLDKFENEVNLCIAVNIKDLCQSAIQGQLKGFQ